MLNPRKYGAAWRRLKKCLFPRTAVASITCVPTLPGSLSSGGKLKRSGFLERADSEDLHDLLKDLKPVVEIFNELCQRDRELAAQEPDTASEDEGDGQRGP